MTRRTRLALTFVVGLAALPGCATAPISPSSPPPVTSQSASPASTPTPSRATPVPPTSSASAVPLKKLATAKLSAQVADRRTDSVAEGAGGQTASYYLPMNTADVIHAALSPIGTAADAASRLKDARPLGVATCGTIAVSDKQTGACVVPLDGGYLLVNGSGAQSIDLVATFTNALYGTLP